MNKALFLGLNGTIIEPKSGIPFTEHNTGWKFREGMLESIRDYYNQGHVICIVTNQEGIDDGFITPLEFSNLITDVVNSIKMYCNEGYVTYVTFSLRQENRLQVYVADSMKHEGFLPSSHFAEVAKGEFDLDISKSTMVGNATGITRRHELLKINGTLEDLVNGLMKDQEKWLTTTPKNHMEEFMVNTVRMYATDVDEAFKNRYNEFYEISEGNPTVIYKKVKDLSDSDKMFAQNAGMSYIDVDVFLQI